MYPSDVPVPPSAITGPGVKIFSVHQFMEHLNTNGSVPTNFYKASWPENAHLLARDRIIGEEYPVKTQHIFLRITKLKHVIFNPPLLMAPKFKVNRILILWPGRPPIYDTALALFVPPPPRIPFLTQRRQFSLPPPSIPNPHFDRQRQHLHIY